MKRLGLRRMAQLKPREVGIAVFVLVFAVVGAKLLFLSYAASIYPVGDLNSDCVVNGSDITIFQSQWGQSGSLSGDLNSDGTVDAFDLSTLLHNWGATCSTTPNNTALPAISGTTTAGDVLTTTNGTWTNSPTSYTYQWQNCSGSTCTNLSGATNSSYTLQNSDVGDTIDVIVTATNAAGATSAAAAKTAIVVSSSGPTFQSGAYDLGWDWIGTGAPLSKMSQDYMFALQTEDGSGLDESLLSNVPQKSGQPDITDWVTAVHSAGDQAIITIGGSSDQDWEYACDNGTYTVHGVSPNNQAGFVSNLINFMKTNSFDGIDLDMEDELFTSQGPPSPEWTSCAEAIIAAAHATTSNGHVPIVDEAIITNWEGSWAEPFEASLDQFNLMTYGDTCTSSTSCSVFASDLADTLGQLCPSGSGQESCEANVKSRSQLGVEMDGDSKDEATCGYVTAYAKNQGLDGVFDWDLYGDKQISSTFPCQTAIFANE